MSLVYTSTHTLTADTGPSSDQYAPIPGLSPLTLSSISLGSGGTALINLYLGWAWSGDTTDFNFYVTILDTASNFTVIENGLGGTVGLNGLINISAVYNIPANSQPVLEAYWKVLGTSGVQIFPPSVFSLSAQVFPAIAEDPE